MTTEQNLFDESLFNDDVNCDVKMNANESNFIPIAFIPPSGKEPTVGKIVRDPRLRNGNKGNPYFPVHYHEYRIGPANEDIRFFFSPSAIGLPDRLSEMFWVHVKERALIKDKEGQQYKYLSSCVQATRPKNGALLYWLEKGKNKVQVMFIKEPMKDAIFGCEAGYNKPPMDGVIKKLREMHLNVFDLKDPAGWIKLYKQGMSKSTTFHAEIVMMLKEEVLPNGRRKTSQEALEFTVDPNFFATLSLETLPDFAEVIKQRTWSVEEIDAYIESDYSKIPERCIKRDKKPVEETANPEMIAAYDDISDNGDNTAKVSDIPF